ncbi:hypothetical protein OF83DRAFT_20199 [Amylostereum chailletii]|nr:hypothetical protein OF83DRAFT_20199 [Amylostereum chailletii]
MPRRAPRARNAKRFLGLLSSPFLFNVLRPRLQTKMLPLPWSFLGRHLRTSLRHAFSPYRIYTLPTLREETKSTIPHLHRRTHTYPQTGIHKPITPFYESFSQCPYFSLSSSRSRSFTAMSYYISPAPAPTNLTFTKHISLSSHVSSAQSPKTRTSSSPTGLLRALPPMTSSPRISFSRLEWLWPGYLCYGHGPRSSCRRCRSFGSRVSLAL